MITASGKYDLTPEEYHGQPCDALSVSSSGLVLLAEKTPAHLKASWDFPEQDQSKAADLGTIAHELLLEPFLPEPRIVVVDADDWRTKDAREVRDAARDSGKTPILKKDRLRAEAVVQAVRAHPIASQLLKKGEAEKSWFAKDKPTGLYRKCRTDFFTHDRIIVDLKTVGSCSPAFLQRRLYDGSWFQKAPWYCEVVERVQGEPAKGYCWICVEQEYPHAVVVRKPPDAVLMHGHRVNQDAWKVFAKCAAENKWPAWGDTLEELDLPTYAYYRLEEEALKQEGPSNMRAAKLAREENATPYA